jgi:hypothetical protein
MTVDTANTRRKYRLHVYGTFERDKEEVAFFLLADPSWPLHTLLQYAVAYYFHFYRQYHTDFSSSSLHPSSSLPIEAVQHYLLRIPLSSSTPLTNHKYVDLMDMNYM